MQLPSDVVYMAPGVDLRAMNITDLPVSVDEIGDPLRVSEEAQRSIVPRDRLVGICDDAEVQPVMRGESTVRFPVLRGDADDLRAEPAQQLHGVPKRARLCGAAEGLVLGVEVQDDPPAAKRGQSEPPAFLIRSEEVRGQASDVEHVLTRPRTPTPSTPRSPRRAR